MKKFVKVDGFFYIFAPLLILKKMKKNLLLLVAALMMMPAMKAQTRDNVARECVLFELFTGINCSYCPAAANAVAQMMEEGLNIAPVAFHTSAFSSAAYYTDETNARANYYGISSYPTLKADGVAGMSGGGSASQTNYSSYLGYYNQRINVASPFTIDLSYEAVEGTTCRVNCTVTKVGDCSGNDVRVFIALTQCNIAQNWMGIQGLHHVCRDLIPNQLGTQFTGTTMTVNETFEMKYPKEDCYLTAWVQNYSGGAKEVYQAVRMPMNLDLDYDLVLKKVENIVTESCSGRQTPMFEVKNYGHETVTSFDMCATDGRELFRQTWHGSLAQGETVTAAMDEIEIGTNGAIQFYVEMPNGHADQFMPDNYGSATVSDAKEVSGTMFLQLKTGSYHEGLAFEVTDMATGQLVHQYTFDQNNHSYKIYIPITEVGCYRFTMRDDTGNGMGTGFMQMKDDVTGELVMTAGLMNPFTYSLSIEANSNGVQSVGENGDVTMAVYPNPSNGLLHLNLGDGQWNVSVYDVTGRLIMESLCDGDATVDLRAEDKGLYLLKAVNGNREVYTKFVIK